MADCDWAVLCDYAFRDANRKLCLIGIFDRVLAPAVPTGLRQSAFVAKLVGDANERVKVRIEIAHPITHEAIAQLVGEIVLGENGIGEVQLSIVGLPLPEWGIYEFNIYANEVPLKTVGITVAQVPQK